MPHTTCTHLARDHDGNCLRCAREDELRAAKAAAYAEGWNDRDNYCSEPYSPRIANPYDWLAPGADLRAE